MKDYKEDFGQNKIKGFLFLCGIYGFICGLLAFVILMMLNVPLSLIEPHAGKGPVMTAITLLSDKIGYIFAVPFISFAVLIISLLLPPKEEKLSSSLTKHLIYIAFIFLSGMALTFLIPVLTLMIFLSLKFSETGEIILLSVAFFMLAILIFAFTVCYVIMKKISGRKEFQDAGGLANKITGIFKTDYSSRTEEEIKKIESIKTRRKLSKIEKWAGFALGITVFIIFQAQDIASLMNTLKVPQEAKNIFSIIFTTSSIVKVFSIFIFIFSALIIIKALKTLLIRG